MKKSLVVGYCVPALATFLACAGGCTVTTNTSDAPDGSTVTPGPDGGTSTDGGGTSSGILGFTPTNIASALVGIDTSTLGDVVVAKAREAVTCDEFGRRTEDLGAHHRVAAPGTSCHSVY